MSRRAKHQPPAGSRRTRRAELLPPASLAESRTPQIVSNPIFRCEAGPSQPNKRPSPGDQLRCAYRPGSLYALVHDPASPSPPGPGIGKAHPLPLPPCRAHPSGRVGPAHAVGVPHARLLRRAAPAPHDDPFLAAYVACSKSAGGKDDAAAEAAVDRRRPQPKQRQGRRRRKTKKEEKKCKAGEVLFRRCGIWSGWAAGATKYAGAMSCRYGACAVVAGHKGDAPATATKSETKDASAAGPTLDLSWTPAVLSARALERREQR